MRSLVLTHIAEETDLSTAETAFFLIFNGTVRIEVSKEVLQKTLRELQANETREANGHSTSSDFASPLSEAGEPIDDVFDETPQF